MKITDGMIGKLDKIEARYNEVGEMLGDPLVISNQKEFKALSKEHSDLTPIVEIYARYKKHKSEFDDCEQMISLETNPDMKAMFKQVRKKRDITWGALSDESRAPVPFYLPDRSDGAGE